MTAEFTGLRALVTGGASGIGAAIVREFLDRGAQVASLDLQPSGSPLGSSRYLCDIADDSSVEGAVAAAAEHLGGIDIVVNNAGMGAQGTIADNSSEEWLRVLDVNVVGIARVTRNALPHLLRSKNAAVVNTSSIAATAGLPARALYSASKGAVLALTRAMAADHLADGIRVNAVTPGTADTPWVNRLLETATDPEAERAALEARQPHGRLVTPEEIAHAVAFLASPRARSTTGTAIAVDGGMQELRLRGQP
ncbi:SDR family oxidoreductase [Rathayibacter sp. ZW T2_19]|uniref:SDR family oxidoreductase n=1 Tax=Rathayibacter rubneri TaxID=2950106 RepID=A0A9X2DVC2_9MICO|nr:SDR family oxidoreductase [Rathayibacter rubneri]MCM6761198.1 SDR family oxidoreductase [Rathayibacter rubneri]